GWMPFHDDQLVETVSGTQLKSALERGAAQLPPDLLADGGTAFLQLSGGSYTIDCAGAVQLLDGDGDLLAEGARISRLEVGGELRFDRDAGIDRLATSTVRLVVNSFVAAGLAGHVSLSDGADGTVLPFPQFDIEDELVAAVAASSPIAPHLDGRITILG